MLAHWSPGFIKTSAFSLKKGLVRQYHQALICTVASPPAVNPIIPWPNHQRVLKVNFVIQASICEQCLPQLEHIVVLHFPSEKGGFALRSV
jgi:hypothetical protein